MVSKDAVEKQLKKINFNSHAWGRAEVNELQHIMIDHEEIYECVNGMYDGGFALLVATNIRLLLVDKKPMNYLTVEDLRFDMINEIDYSHRLVGARINVSAGSKNLSFMSFNQQRLRKAISHVQRCMAEAKKQQSDHAEDQKQHLAQINQQLQAYLLAQHQQQDKLRAELEEVQKGQRSPEDVHIDQELKPSPELSDYLLARSLMAQAQQEIGNVSGTQSEGDEPKDKKEEGHKKPDEPKADDNTLKAMEQVASPSPEPVAAIPAQTAAATPAQSTLPPAPRPEHGSPDMADLYAAGMQEIYGRREQKPEAATTAEEKDRGNTTKVFDINPLHIAYSKLPLALRNKKFGRPSFHAHSKSDNTGQLPQNAQPANQQYY